MKMKKLALVVVTLLLVLGISACKATDVVGRVAITSFEVLLNENSDKVSYNEAGNHWILESPAGETFAWSKDFSSNQPDASVGFDAEPFIKAGLNVEKLPQQQYLYDGNTGRITMPYELGQDKFQYEGTVTALDSFKMIVDQYRDVIDYHEKFDHYGIVLGNGNVFEWAKDMSKNDKDIVFVLNPQPFIDAGVDPNKIDGWVFTKVEIRNEQGKVEQVEKILKFFDLD